MNPIIFARASASARARARARANFVDSDRSTLITSVHDYRLEIDGLRALAVMAVMGYHAFAARLPGGFLGVDLFFAISGYVITRQLIRENAAADFKVSEFYYRRLRRIFPALLATLALVVGTAPLLLLGSEMGRLLDSLFSASMFSANLYEWATVNYFGPDAITQPLLHLWSLSTEEQFYFFWPLVLAWSWNRRPGLMLTGIAMASLAAWVITRGHDASAAFYLPQYRSWELLAGAGVALWRDRPVVASLMTGHCGRKWFWFREALTVTCLCVCLILLTGKLGPDPQSVIAPILLSFATLVLLAGIQPGNLVQRILSFAPLRFVGRISYPLYLVHWPILSLACIGLGELSKWQRLQALAVSFVIAGLFYFLIEKPIRRKPASAPLALALIAGLASLTGVAFAVAAVQGPGLDPREAYIAQASVKADMQDFYRLNHGECRFLDDGRIPPQAGLPASCTPSTSADGWLLWGDSHAEQLRAGLDSTLAGRVGLMQVTSPGCLPRWMTAQQSANSTCDRANLFALRLIRERRPKVVVVAERNRHDQNDWLNMARQLRALGVGQLIVIGPVPEWSQYLPRLVATRLNQDPPERSREYLSDEPFRLDHYLRSTVGQSGELTYVSMTDRLCKDAGCLVRLGSPPNDALTSFDYGHLTLAASRFVAQAIAQAAALPPPLQ